jgi:hypothetical protein
MHCPGQPASLPHADTSHRFEDQIGQKQPKAKDNESCGDLIRQNHKIGNERRQRGDPSSQDASISAKSMMLNNPSYPPALGDERAPGGERTFGNRANFIAQSKITMR